MASPLADCERHNVKPTAKLKPFSCAFLTASVVMIACSPVPREGGAVLGPDEEGGKAGAANTGGRPMGGSSGGSAGAAPSLDAAPSGNPAMVDGGTSLDSSIDGAYEPATKLDAAPKLDAPPPTSYLKPLLPGEPLNCALPPLPMDDVIAHFFAHVGGAGVGDRAPASAARLLGDGTAGTHSAMLMDEARCNSTKSSVYSGSGFTFWGSIIAIDFKGGADPGPFYDATRYKGIAFFARSNVAMTVRAKISDRNTARWGGVCDLAAGKCDDNWGRHFP